MPWPIWQHPEWFVPDDAVYMAEHISGPKGFCLVAEEKTTGALAAYFTVKLAGTAPMLWAGSWA